MVSFKKNTNSPSLSFTNTNGKGFLFKCDLIFYFAIFWPFLATIVYDISSLNLVPINYFAGLFLLIISMHDLKIYKPLEAILFCSALYIILLVFVKMTVGSYDFVNILKLLSNLGIAAYFIKFSLPGFKLFAFISSIVVFLSYYIMIFFSEIILGGVPIGFSYHDSGLFIVILWTMLILKSERHYDLNVNLLFLFLVLFLIGRTQIIMALFIFLFALWPIFKNQTILAKSITALLIIPLPLSLLLFPNQVLDLLSNIYVLKDLMDRGVSLVTEDVGANIFDENLRLFVWNCYVINFDYLTFIFGHDETINECVRNTWDSAYSTPILQYENSFIRLNQESGIAASIYILLFFISSIFAFLKKDFFLLGLLLLFAIRAFTGDIFFFYYKDYILFILFTYAIYENKKVYN